METEGYAVLASAGFVYLLPGDTFIDISGWCWDFVGKEASKNHDVTHGELHSLLPTKRQPVIL